MRPRPTTRPEPTITEGQRAELLDAIEAVPVGVDCHDERAVQLAKLWYQLHIPPEEGRYAIYRVRCATAIGADVLDDLRAAAGRRLPRQRLSACPCGFCAD